MIMSGIEFARYVNFLVKSIQDRIFLKYFPEFDNRLVGITETYRNVDEPCVQDDYPSRLDSFDNQYILIHFKYVRHGELLIEDSGSPRRMGFVPGQTEYDIMGGQDGNQFISTFSLGSGEEEDSFQKSVLLNKWDYFMYEFLIEMNRLDSIPVLLYFGSMLGFIVTNRDTLELLIMENYENTKIV